MDVTSVFLGTLLGFLLGYLFGYQILKIEKILISLSDFKKNLEHKFTPRQKLFILNSKDELPENEEE